MPSMTSHMRCYYTGQAELVVGLILSVVGLLFILIPNKKVQFALAIALALGGIIAFLIPTVLVGVCKSSRMTCRALTLPSLLILSSFVILLSVIHTIILYKTERGGHKSNETQSVDNGTTIGI